MRKKTLILITSLFFAVICFFTIICLKNVFMVAASEIDGPLFVSNDSVNINDGNLSATVVGPSPANDIVVSSGGGGGVPPAVNVLTVQAQKVDVNKDNKIDVLDFNSLMVNWGAAVSAAGAGSVAVADFSGDGKVDILDFNMLMVNWTG